MAAALRRALALALVVLLAACAAEKPSFRMSDISGSAFGRDFALTDQNGTPRTLADFRGKAVVLFFGYTHCPDVCPTTMADLVQAKRLLGKDAERVQVLFVTVDPERDDRELLAKYVPAFDPSFLGLYGDAQATEQAARAFGVVYSKQPTASGYTVDHSSASFLIDPAGKVRLLAPYGQRADWLADDLRLLLALDKATK